MTRPTLRPVHATASLCADFQSAQAGEYAVENNTWGKGELTSLRQCMDIAAANGGGANVAFDWTCPAARRWTRSRWAASPGTCTPPPPHGAPSPGSTSPISPAPRYPVPSLDLRQFLDHLKARGSITGREWLASVELGSGRMTLSQFEVSVESRVARAIATMPRRIRLGRLAATTGAGTEIAPCLQTRSFAQIRQNLQIHQGETLGHAVAATH